MIAAAYTVTPNAVFGVAGLGIAAVIAMYVISWWDRKPKTYKHYPPRHVCGDCNAPWTQGHTCQVQIGGPVRGEITRSSTDLERRNAP